MPFLMCETVCMNGLGSDRASCMLTRAQQKWDEKVVNSYFFFLTSQIYVVILVVVISTLAPP